MEPSLQTVKRLFALSSNCCAFTECDLPIVEESGTVTGKICHIKARKEGGPRYDPNQTNKERHSFDNLILMCARHSQLIDFEHKKYTVDSLHEMKNVRERKGSLEFPPSDACKAELLWKNYKTLYISAGGNVMINSPGAVQANEVVIKSRKKIIKITPPDGCIASDLSKRNYIKHLIDQYNDFASKQPGRTLHFPVIYVNIKKHFGAKWDFIPIHCFDDLSSFLKKKIDNTMLGRINKSKGIPNYSEFDKYCEKYNHIQVDDSEMAEILANEELVQQLRKGSREARGKKGTMGVSPTEIK